MTEEQELEKSDLEWLSDFEKAVVRAAFECGTNLDSRILNALNPILKNAGARDLKNPPVMPEKTSTLDRLVEMFKGGKAFLEGKEKSFSEMWESGEIDEESAKTFTRIMFDKSRLPARIHCAVKPFQGIKTLVDLGGGGGGWAVEAIAAQPQLEYTIFDLKSVCRVTDDILKSEAPSIAGRVKYVEGNFFKDRIPSADGYLMSNILHDWNPATCRKILGHVKKSIPSGAKLFVHECLLDEDKNGPRFTCLYNMLMLLNHSAQQFTHAEISNVLTDSGFGAPQVASKAAHYSLLRSTVLPA